MLSYNQITTFVLCNEHVSDETMWATRPYLLQVLEDDILQGEVNRSTRFGSCRQRTMG